MRVKLKKKNMKNRLEKLEKIGLAIVMFSLLALFAFGCKTNQTSLQYHQNLQKELTYAKAMERNESFTMKSYEDDLKRLKDKLNELDKKALSDKRKAELLKEIDEIRAKIESYGKN